MNHGNDDLFVLVSIVGIIKLIYLQLEDSNAHLLCDRIAIKIKLHFILIFLVFCLKFLPETLLHYVRSIPWEYIE